MFAYIKMVHVDTIELLNMPHFQTIDMYKIGVHGDGSCLIHTILYLTDKKYRKLSTEDKQKEGHRYRIELANNLLDSLSNPTDKHLKYLGDFLNTEISPFIDTDKFTSINEYIEKEFKDPKEYLGEIAIGILEKIFNLQFIFIQNNQFYVRSIFNDNKKDIILIHYIEDLHYEPIAIKDDENDDFIYIIGKNHSSLRKKISRNYEKYVQQLITKEQKSSTISTPLNLDNVLPYVVEDKTLISIDEHEDNEFTHFFIAEKDIIFDPIDDLDSIIITRIDQNASINFTKNQSIHEINELFSKNVKNISSVQNQVYIDLLFAEPKSFEFKRFFVPVISAHKQYSTYYNIEPKNKLADPANEFQINPYKGDTYLPLQSYFQKLRHIKLRNNEVYMSDFLKLTKMLFESTGVSEKIDDRLLRLCPSLYEDLLTYQNYAIDFDVCFDFVNRDQYKYTSSVQNLSQNYLESYRTPDRTFKVCGYFSTHNSEFISKEDDNVFTIFNVTKYFEEIKSASIGSKLKLSFLNGKQRKGTIISKSNSFIQIQLNKEIEYKSEMKNTLYYYISKNELDLNWFFVNLDNQYTHFDKRMLFKRSYLFLFEEKDYDVFKKLFVPKFEELHLIKQNSWYTIHDCTRDLQQYFDITSNDIQNDFIKPIPKLEQESTSIHEIPKPIKIDFSNNVLLQFKEHLKNYPELKTNSKYNDSLLQRAFKLEHSFDNGFSYVLQQFQNLVFKETKPIKDIEKLENIKNKTKYTPIQQEKFYGDVEDFLKVKDILNENDKYVGLNHVIQFMKANNSPPKYDNVTLLLDNITPFFKNNYKPQSVKNTSFLKSLKHHQSTLQGDADFVDYDNYFSPDDNQTYLNIVTDQQNIENKDVIIEVLKNITTKAGFILSEKEYTYVKNNYSSFRNNLVKDKLTNLLQSFLRNEKDKKRIEAFKKKLNLKKPSLEDFYNKIVLTSFILILTSLNVNNIQITRIHPKCKNVFELSGYPLNTTDNKSKSTLNYLSCLITHVYSNDEYVKSEKFIYNEIKRTTETILDAKDDLRNALANTTVNSRMNLIDNKIFKPVNFKPQFSITNHCKRTSFDLISKFETIQVPYKNHIYIQQLNIFQLTKSFDKKQDLFQNEIIDNMNIDFLQTYKEQVVENLYVYQNVDKQTITDLSEHVEEKFNDLCMAIRYHKNDEILKDSFITFKNQSSDDTEIKRLAIFSYSENKMLNIWSKIVHDFNYIQHIEYLNRISVFHAKSSPSITEYLRNLYTQRENTLNKRISDILNIDKTIKEKLVNIQLMPKEYQQTDNIRHSCLLCMNRIVSFCTEIYNTNKESESMQSLIFYILDGIVEEIEIYRLNAKDYTKDVERLREDDKQRKFEEKDRLSDQERTALDKLKEVGLSYQDIYDGDNDDINDDINDDNEFYDFNIIEPYNEYVTNHGTSPDDDPYVGENED